METLSSNSIIIDGLTERQQTQVSAYAKHISECIGWNFNDRNHTTYYVDKRFGGGTIKTDTIGRTELSDEVDITIVDTIRNIKSGVK